MARVLIADDDRDVRESLTILLEMHGHSVVQAWNGRDALERLHSGPRPSLILLDLMMPVMDGWQFRRAQLGDPAVAPIPVVVISAVPEHLRRSDELRATKVFGKPFDYDCILSMVDALPS